MLLIKNPVFKKNGIKCKEKQTRLNQSNKLSQSQIRIYCGLSRTRCFIFNTADRLPKCRQLIHKSRIRPFTQKHTPYSMRIFGRRCSYGRGMVITCLPSILQTTILITTSSRRRKENRSTIRLIIDQNSHIRSLRILR